MKNFSLNCFDFFSPEKITDLGSHETFLFQENPYYLLKKKMLHPFFPPWVIPVAHNSCSYRHPTEKHLTLCLVLLILMRLLNE